MTTDHMTKDILEFFPIPDEIRKLADMANNDLYNGPTYYDGDGNECSMFDDVETGVTAFNFTDACHQISDWCGDNLLTVYVDQCFGEITITEPEGDEDEDGNWIDPGPYYEVDYQEVKRILFGRELASHI
jgi:hypothetical protein